MSIITARRRKGSAGIFTASMADVVFLLIVFFVLTYAVSPDLTRIELPKTVLRTEVPRDAALISVASPDDGQIIRVSTGRELALPVTSAEEIVSFAANVLAANPRQVFVVKADRGVRYKQIDSVLQALRDADAKVIYLLSEQSTAADA